MQQGSADKVRIDWQPLGDVGQGVVKSWAWIERIEEVSLHQSKGTWTSKEIGLVSSPTAPQALCTLPSKQQTHLLAGVGEKKRAETRWLLCNAADSLASAFSWVFFYSHVFVVCCTCHIPSHWFSNDQDTIPHRLQCRRDAQSEHRNDCRPQLTAQWATKLIKICVSNHVLQTSGTLSTICSISTSCLVSL